MPANSGFLRIGYRSPGSVFVHFHGENAESLWAHAGIFPFSGDRDRRLVSIHAAWPVPQLFAVVSDHLRQDVDALGLESQKRAANAIKNGHFDKSLVPVYRGDSSLALDREEYPRPQTTFEGLAGLKPAFTAVADYPLDDKGTTYRNLILQKYPDLDINFMHHAGNSSGVVDGSAAVLLASPNYARAHHDDARDRLRAGRTGEDKRCR